MCGRRCLLASSETVGGATLRCSGSNQLLGSAGPWSSLTLGLKPSAVLKGRNSALQKSLVKSQAFERVYKPAAVASCNNEDLKWTNSRPPTSVHVTEGGGSANRSLRDQLRRAGLYLRQPLGASECDDQWRIVCRWLSEQQGMMGETLKGSREAGVLEGSDAETRTWQLTTSCCFCLTVSAGSRTSDFSRAMTDTRVLNHPHRSAGGTGNPVCGNLG